MTTSPTARLEALQSACPLSLTLRALLPGRQPHEHYLHRRFAAQQQRGEWFEPGEPVVEFAGRLHDALERADALDVRVAIVEALRELDPELCDLERLWRNGATYREIGELTGHSQGQLRSRIDHMRALGFPLPYRYAAHRRKNRGVDTHKSRDIVRGGVQPVGGHWKKRRRSA